MTSDTSELGLEALIVRDMTSKAGGWIAGTPSDYNREYCVDLKQLTTFLRTTQPEVSEALDLDEDTPTRRKFLSRLQGEITKRGTIDVLRHGIRHGPHDITLFLRNTLARQRQGQAAVRGQPLQCHPPASLQP